MDTNSNKYFYRYRNFDDDRCIKSLELLFLKNEMYLSSPLDFNDPYDCRPHFLAEGTEREMRAYFKETVRKANPRMTKGDINALATKLLKNYHSSGRDFSSEFKDEYYNEMVPAAGMVCFTKIPDNILMWSHYASSHSGICLRFEAQAEVKSIFHHAFEVKYTTEFPVINFLTCPKSEVMVKGLLTKAKDWEYEHEYRIIHDARHKKVSFPEESLTGVIFGLKTTSEHRSLVTGWVKSRKNKPTIYEAKMKNREYGIDIVKIT